VETSFTLQRAPEITRGEERRGEERRGGYCPLKQIHVQMCMKTLHFEFFVVHTEHVVTKIIYKHTNTCTRFTKILVENVYLQTRHVSMLCGTIIRGNIKNIKY
jgi:hypothetical protein